MGRGLVSSLAGLALLLGLLLAGLPGPSPADPLAAAVQALEQGDVAAAEELLGSVLARGETPPALRLLGRLRLARTDPAGAARAFRRVLRVHPQDAPSRAGLAQALLTLHRPEEALALVRPLCTQDPSQGPAWALAVRALLDLGQPRDALAWAEAGRQASRPPGGELLAAHGAALFRLARIDEAAAAYRVALAAGGEAVEAHLRLGSGLLPGDEAIDAESLRPALAALEEGRTSEALPLLEGLVARAPGVPLYHRLLGDLLEARLWERSFLAGHPAVRTLERLRPDPGPAELPLAAFFPAYPGLSAARKAVVHRVARCWGAYLPRLVAGGARHDLLPLLEGPTADPARAGLRGRQTADGRWWDHVRGVGGHRAATGLEALDWVGRLGFDTLAHEVTHQVHLYAFGPGERVQVERLYRAARREARCLDYYAATCAEEYLAQGCEAFLALAKEPGCRRTHGHTRFELIARDPELEAFLRQTTSWDPLAGPERADLLETALELALLAGRPEEALIVSALLGGAASPRGLDLREQALAEAGRAGPVLPGVGVPPPVPLK